MNHLCSYCNTHHGTNENCRIVGAARGIQGKHITNTYQGLVKATEKYRELMDNPDIQIECEPGDNCVLCVAWDNLKSKLDALKEGG